MYIKLFQNTLLKTYFEHQNSLWYIEYTTYLSCEWIQNRIVFQICFTHFGSWSRSRIYLTEFLFKQKWLCFTDKKDDKAPQKVGIFGIAFHTTEVSRPVDSN